MKHLMALTSSGAPIFSKKSGHDTQNLPYSTFLTLAGAFLFCKSQDVELTHNYLEDGSIIVWKEYENQIMMIVIAKGPTEKVLLRLLDLTFNAMVLYVGINEVRNIRNVDRFKRDLKNYFQLVDQLLEQSETDLLDYNESILLSQNDNLSFSQKLLQFSEQIFAPFTCLLIRNKIVCGTEAWWDLNVTDRKLLILLLSLSSASQKPDHPVFLPEKSPTMAYRLVSIQLTPAINICILCGNKPKYSELEAISKQFFQNDFDILLSAETSHPRNFPPSVELDSSILGILLINCPQSKYLMSRNVQQASKRTGTHRLDILRTFFHQAVDSVEQELKQSKFYDVNTNNIKITEQFWNGDYHKCHVLVKDEHILCVLYIAAIQTHTMRLITQKTLNTLIAEKDSVW